MLGCNRGCPELGCSNQTDAGAGGAGCWCTRRGRGGMCNNLIHELLLSSVPPSHAPGRSTGSTLPSNSAAGQSRRARSFCASCLLLFNISWQSRSAGVAGGSSVPSPAQGLVVGPWPLPSSCQHRAGQAGGRGTGLAAGTGGSQGSGSRGCAEFGAGGWGSWEDEGLLSLVLWLGGPGQGCARGPRQDAGRRGEHWMRSVPPRWDAQRGTPAGCASQHPQGMHRTAPTRDAQNGTHAGCTSLQPRGRHRTAPTRDAHR